MGDTDKTSTLYYLGWAERRAVCGPTSLLAHPPALTYVRIGLRMA